MDQPIPDEVIESINDHARKINSRLDDEEISLKQFDATSSMSEIKEYCYEELLDVANFKAEESRAEADLEVEKIEEAIAVLKELRDNTKELVEIMKANARGEDYVKEEDDDDEEEDGDDEEEDDEYDDE